MRIINIEKMKLTIKIYLTLSLLLFCFLYSNAQSKVILEPNEFGNAIVLLNGDKKETLGGFGGYVKLYDYKVRADSTILVVIAWNGDNVLRIFEKVYDPEYKKHLYKDIHTNFIAYLGRCNLQHLGNPYASDDGNPYSILYYDFKIVDGNRILGFRTFEMFIQKNGYPPSGRFYEDTTQFNVTELETQFLDSKAKRIKQFKKLQIQRENEKR